MDEFRLGAFAVIFDGRDAALLCLREDLDLWNLPGGRVERAVFPWPAVVWEARKTREAVEARYFVLEKVPERSNRRHVEMIRDVSDHRGETVMKTQTEPSAKEMVERGLL
jgi:hypothetical protein